MVRPHVLEDRVLNSEFGMRNAERKTEDGKQMTEVRGQKSEDREQRTENRGQRTDDREQKTDYMSVEGGTLSPDKFTVSVILR